MFKLVVLSALLAVAAAAPGFVGAGYAAPYAASYASPYASPYAAPYAAHYAAPIAAPWGHGYVGAPVVKAAVPVATSYANTVRIASPAVVAAPAPYAVAAHGPVLASPLAHAW